MLSWLLDEEDRKALAQLLPLAIVGLVLGATGILALAAAAGLAVRLFGLLAG